MIRLKFVEGNIFVYDIEDWISLRNNHRIVGQIIGSTNFIPSLPSQLLPEEALLLIDKNLAVMYESTGTYNNDTNAKTILEDTLLKEQQREYREIRKAQLESLIENIMIKRRKLGDERPKEEIFNEELEKSCVVTKKNMVWPILLKDDLSEFKPISRETLLSLTTSLKLTIFKDLWERGYFITNGAKFGGDFLVYFGDPIVHHAIFIVKCVETEKEFTPIELIAFGRLGVSVKKRAVLGSIKDGKVEYLTLNWIDA